MITQFRVQNYKGLRDVVLDLTPVHVLIGPNNSGKTSILEAVQALCRSVDYPLEQAFTGAWKGCELVHRGDSKRFVTLEASLLCGSEELSYRLKCRFSVAENRSVKVTGETYTDKSVIDFNFTDVASFTYLLSNAIIQEDSVRADAASQIHDALSGVHLYRWNPQMLALPTAPDASRKYRMDASGFGLALCLDDILGYDRTKFDLLETRLKRIFPEVGSIKLIPCSAFRAPDGQSNGTPLLEASDGKGVYFQIGKNPALVPAAQVSDGILIVLAYLALLSLPKPPRVILLEEPENGIHPKRLRDVFSILRDLVKENPSTQIILTTHSPYALDMFEPEEVTLCRQVGGETKVSRLSDSKSVRDQQDIFSLGEIWTADGDDRMAIPETAVGTKTP